MDFDRLLGSAQVAGNLFVQFASDHIFEHFPLTWCERGQARADFGKFGLLPPKGAVFLNRHTNRCKQVFIVPGLGEEITGAIFHRLDEFLSCRGSSQLPLGRQRRPLQQKAVEQRS